MDIGPSSRAKDKSDKFHMWDYESDEKPHTVSLKPNQIQNIEVTEETFEPSEFITWLPKWFIIRGWGSILNRRNNAI